MPKKQKTKPLTIAIHGEDLDIEATLRGSSRGSAELKEALTIALKRMTGETPEEQRIFGSLYSEFKEALTIALKRMTGETPEEQRIFGSLYSEFKSTLRKEQLETIMQVLDMNQKLQLLALLHQADAVESPA